MPGSGPIWEDDFPLHDEFEDFSGRKRKFIVECHEGALGYTVYAREESPDDEGYEFRIYSETSAYSALGHLRGKARRAMAMRHLDNKRSMLHDELEGRITSNSEGETILVVDGLAVTMYDLERMLESYQGWEFELRIKSGME